MRLLIASILCLLYVVNGHQDPNIEPDLGQHFQKFVSVRHPTVNEGDNWREARKYISEWFFKNSLTLKVQKYNTTVSNLLDEEVETVGQNIIGISEGSKEGNVIVVAADYDTSQKAPSALKSNGVAVSSLLEIVKIYNNRVRTNDFEALYDVIFVALDLNTKKHYPSRGIPGAEVFVKEWLLPYLKDDVTKLRGAIILDEISNVNFNNGSQELYPGYSKYFPEAYYRITESGDKGDFLAMIDYYGQDDKFASDFSGIFNRGKKLSKFRLQEMNMKKAIPGDATFGRLVDELEKSSQGPFWNHNLTALLLTDTGAYRKDACSDSMCRPKEYTTDDRGEFIGYTTRAIIDTLFKLQAKHLKVDPNGATITSLPTFLTLISSVIMAYLLN